MFPHKPSRPFVIQSEEYNTIFFLCEAQQLTHSPIGEYFTSATADISHAEGVFHIQKQQCCF